MLIEAGYWYTAGRSHVRDPIVMTLLCVDDDPDDFILFKEAVAHCGFRCACLHADNGQTALTILEHLRPDLIFLDNNMPLMNGRETLVNIRKDRAFQDVPIYMLSTFIGPGECDAFKALGATGCLRKPDSFPELCAVLEKTLHPYIQSRQ